MFDVCNITITTNTTPLLTRIFVKATDCFILDYSCIPIRKLIWNWISHRHRVEKPISSIRKVPLFSHGNIVKIEIKQTFPVLYCVYWLTGKFQDRHTRKITEIKFNCVTYKPYGSFSFLSPIHSLTFSWNLFSVFG